MVIALTEDGCRARRQRLWDRIPDPVEWVLLGDPRHVQHLCGFRVNPVSFSADQSGLLLLTRDGRATLFLDNFLRRSAAAPYYVSDEVVATWYDGRSSIGGRYDALAKSLAGCRDRWSGRRGLIESDAVSAMVASVIGDDATDRIAVDRDTSITLGDVARAARRFKDPDEIAILRHCVAAGAAGHRVALEMTRPGVSELEVYFAVQRAAQEFVGAPCVVYGDFRATNAAAPKLGGMPTDYRTREGDLFILDFSVTLLGYRGDTTNTIAVGTPSEAARAQAEACRAALLAAESRARPGVACRDVWGAASSVLEARGFGSLGGHAGHGLGLAHPEAPVLGASSDDVLMVGDVFTIEPGCYVAGTGGVRLEYNYRVTDSGVERLGEHRLALTP